MQAVCRQLGDDGALAGVDAVARNQVVEPITPAVFAMIKNILLASVLALAPKAASSQAAVDFDDGNLALGRQIAAANQQSAPSSCSGRTQHDDVPAAVMS